MLMCAMLVRLLRFLPFFRDIGQRLVEREIKPSACPLLFRRAAGDDRGERERDRAHHLENRIPPNRPPLLVGAKPTHEIARQAFDRMLVDASKFYRLEFQPGRRDRLPDHSIFPRRFCHMAANVLSLPLQRAAPSAPMIPQAVQTMRGPNDGTGTVIRPCVNSKHCLMVTQSMQLTDSEHTPFARACCRESSVGRGVGCVACGEPTTKGAAAAKKPHREG